MAQLKDTLIAGNLRVTDTVIADTIKKEGGTSSQFLKADGSIDSNTYALSSAVPSAPGTLKTDNTSAQSTSASESLSGTINLHKVSKTGSYNDLLDKPTVLDNVFTATYGTTTAAEIQAAYSAGKQVICIRNNAVYSLASIDTTYTYFGAAYSANTKWLRVLNSNSTWSEGLVSLESISNKVSSWSSTTTDTNYPSEKLVKDSLDIKYEKPSSGIPAADIASGVIPTVPTISTNIATDATSDEMTASPKAVKTFVENKGYTTNTGTVTGVTAGAGLNTTSNDTGTDGGTISSSGTLHLTKSGVTAGTYQGITVDKYGRVTSASNQGYTTNTGTVTGVTVGTTAYTPTSGVVTIPAYPSVPVTDVTVGGTSVVSSGTAVIPAIPTVPTISTDLLTDKADNTKVAGAKAAYDEIHPQIISSWPQNNTFQPNVLYDLSSNVTSTKSVVLPYTQIDTNITNHWYISFKTGSTAPTITWSSAIVWYGGSAPTISANKHYEVSILYNDGLEKCIGICIETEKS